MPSSAAQEFMMPITVPLAAANTDVPEVALPVKRIISLPAEIIVLIIGHINSLPGHGTLHSLNMPSKYLRATSNFSHGIAPPVPADAISKFNRIGRY